MYSLFIQRRIKLKQFLSEMLLKGNHKNIGKPQNNKITNIGAKTYVQTFCGRYAKKTR